MNLFHRRYCASERWAARMSGTLLPWAMEGVGQLVGGRLLEVGPGPGVTTELLADRFDRVTAVEVDPALAVRLRRRIGEAAVVVAGDGAALPFRAASFDLAVCFTVLHHVPSREVQDRLLAEIRRCLRPGGLLVGSDSLPSLRFRLYHLGDTMVPVDPAGLPDRLAAAGFAEVAVDAGPRSFRFRASAGRPTPT
jgi:SAM-dependent methyltransferase